MTEIRDEITEDDLLPTPSRDRGVVTYYPEAVIDGLDDVIRKLQNEVWVLRAMLRKDQ